MVLSIKYLPASRAVALSVKFTVCSIRKGIIRNCRALRRKVVVSREALIGKASAEMFKLRSPVIKVPAEHIPNRTASHGA